MSEFFALFPHKWMAYTVLATLVFITAWFAAWLLRVMIRRFFSRQADRYDLDPTTFYFIRNGVSFVVYLLAVIFLFYNIPTLKSVGVALFAGAGIFAAIVGFASQSAFANMVSGLMIVIFRPFRVNDVVTLQNITGYIEDITLRHTVVRDFENKRLVIPNSVVAQETIHNFNIEEESVRLHFEIGISYDSDLDKAIEVLKEVALKQDRKRDYRTKSDISKGQEEVMVKAHRYEDSAIILRAWVWTDNPEEAFELKWSMNRDIKIAFDEAGIEIPYPHRTIVYKNEKADK